MHFFCIFFQKNLVMSKKSSTFAPAFDRGHEMSEKNGLLDRFRKEAEILNVLLRKKLRK